MSLPPGLIVAAPRSGAGKTTVTLGLIAALARRGIAVQPFKCGPDYIDPAFHAAAAGRPSFNLDSWAMDRDLIAALLANAAGADLIVAEGSMGLFDGVAQPGAWGDGSNADIAALAGWPVLLVLDVSGQAQSAAAIALGAARYRNDIRLAGVVLNRVASDRHDALVRTGMARAGIPVLGSLSRSEVELPERHLGLVQAEEDADLVRRLSQLADFVAAGCDLDAIAATAGATRLLLRHSRPLPRHSRPLPRHSRGGGNPEPPTPEAAALDPRASASPRPRMTQESGEPYLGMVPAVDGQPVAEIPRPPGQKIALARDEAFSFVYPHLIEGWREAGAEILPFSPLADEAPDPSADVCWLPGGYPELHAGRLAAADTFRQGLRKFAANKPLHGECGGYMVLGDVLIDAAGIAHRMAGLLRLETSFAKRKLHLGYRAARLLAPIPGVAAGHTLRGHEFHYATILVQGDDPLAEVVDANGLTVPETGARRGLVTGSFFHLISG